MCLSGWSLVGYTVVMLWVGASIAAVGVGINRGYGGIRRAG